MFTENNYIYFYLLKHYKDDKQFSRTRAHRHTDKSTNKHHINTFSTQHKMQYLPIIHHQGTQHNARITTTHTRMNIEHTYKTHEHRIHKHTFRSSFSCLDFSFKILCNFSHDACVCVSIAVQPLQLALIILLSNLACLGETHRPIFVFEVESGRVGGIE